MVPVDSDPTPRPRRRWARALSGLLVLAAVALMVSAVGVGAGGWPWEEPEQQADGYPQRIERPYVVRDLPAKPGPLAGLVEAGGSWFAVSPHGRMWTLTDEFEEGDVQPALSADGRVLAYLRESENGFGEYVLRNVVSGELTAFPAVSSSAVASDAAFYVAPQQPAFISPDGDQVLVRGGRSDDSRSTDGMLIDADGVSQIYVRGIGWPAGWSDDGRLTWVVTPSVMEPTDSVEVVTTTDTGEELDRREVELRHRMTLTQWSPLLSPDGSRMVLVGESGGWVTVSLSRGQQAAAGGTTGVHGCQPSWRDDELLFTADGALRDRQNHAVVVADPSLELTCSVWAADALAGGEHQGLTGRVFGTDTAWPTWRWRELAAGGLMLLAALAYAFAGRSREVPSVGEEGA
jgi:hypothetical protein